MSVDLAIDRLSGTLHPADGDPRREELRRVDRVLRRAAETALPAALRLLDLPAGLWFVPRLDVRCTLDPADSDTALAERWTDAWARALAAGIRRGAGAVRYDDEVAVLSDAVAGVATGRTERLWAWRQAGVVRPGDPAPGVAAGDSIVTLLRRRPEHAVATLRAAVAGIGVARLDRVLGRRWCELPGLVAGGAAASEEAARLLGAAEAARGAEWVGGPGRRDLGVHSPEERIVASAEPDARDRAALAGALLAASTLARAFRAARLRPETPVLAAWSVLVVAEADPASLRRVDGGRLVAAVARMLVQDGSGASPTQERRPPAPARPAGSRPAATSPEGTHPQSSSSLPVGSPGASSRPAAGVAVRGPAEPAFRNTGPDGPVASIGVRGTPPTEPVPDDDPPAAQGSGVFTAWAGLPFLLSTAALAGLPDRVVEHPAFIDRPLRWVVHRVGAELVPADAEDPGLLTLAGTDLDHAGWLLDAAPPTPEEQRAVEEVVRDWAAVTAARYLSAGPRELPDDAVREPRGLVARVAGRRGRVSGRPGWIEVRLPIAEIDVAVRRAGLDLDPGWVPWLGTVVRYRYE